MRKGHRDCSLINKVLPHRLLDSIQLHPSRLFPILQGHYRVKLYATACFILRDHTIRLTLQGTESILEDLFETLLDTKHGLAESGKGRSQDSTASKFQAPVGSSSREQVSPEIPEWSLQKGTFTEEIKATLEKHIGWRTLPY
jgi:hypothetical protein